MRLNRSLRNTVGLLKPHDLTGRDASILPLRQSLLIALREPPCVHKRMPQGRRSLDMPAVGKVGGAGEVPRVAVAAPNKRKLSARFD